ncbi:PTS fructose transporter subunit IIC, partial [Vibrio parahaemolyticus]|nr:PTS fructose transporter subunit IIC [Vibrio parahaemolyticus]
MKGKLNEAKDHLMSGISYALPVIIAGSLVVAVAKLIGIIGGVGGGGGFGGGCGFFGWGL